MVKDFDNWNTVKKGIDEYGSFDGYEKLFVKHRQVRYISIGNNIGTEIDGKTIFYKRPVLVLKKIGSLFLCIPLTTKGKNNQYYKKLSSPPFDSNSWIILSQVRTFDKKRFFKHIGTITEYEFSKIKNLLREYYFPKDS